jgi:probable blue pigment (indigoidine) exporter
MAAMSRLGTRERRYGDGRESCAPSAEVAYPAARLRLLRRRGVRSLRLTAPALPSPLTESLPIMVTSPRGSAMLVAAAACWGVGTVISKQALDGVPPLTLLPIQLLVSIAVLVVAAFLVRVRLEWTPNLNRLGALGLLNPGLAYSLGLLGLAHMTASLSVLLWALEPALIVALAFAVLRDAVSSRVRVAIAVALGGVVVVIYQPGSSGTPLGVGLVLLAVAACATYTVVARVLMADEDSLAVVIAQQVAALMLALSVLAVATIVDAGATSVDGLSAATWAAAIGSGAMYYGLAFWLYLAGLRQTSATVAGSFLTLIPVFGLVAGTAYGEMLSTRQLLGASVVIASMATLAWLQRASDDMARTPSAADAGPT